MKYIFCGRPHLMETHEGLELSGGRGVLFCLAKQRESNTNYETTMCFPILFMVGENCTLVVKRSRNKGWH